MKKESTMVALTVIALLLFFAADIPLVGWAVKIAATIVVVKGFAGFISGYTTWKPMLLTLCASAAALLFCLHMPAEYSVFQWLSLWLAAFVVVSIRQIVYRNK